VNSCRVCTYLIITNGFADSATPTPHANVTRLSPAFRVRARLHETSFLVAEAANKCGWLKEGRDIRFICMHKGPCTGWTLKLQLQSQVRIRHELTVTSVCCKRICQALLAIFNWAIPLKEVTPPVDSYLFCIATQGQKLYLLRHVTDISIRKYAENYRLCKQIYNRSTETRWIPRRTN